MDKIEKLAKFGSMPEWAIIAPGGENSTDPLNHAKGVWSESQLIFSAFDEAAATIKASPEFTDEGKATRLAKIGKANLEILAKQRARLAPAKTAHGEAVAKARTAEKSPEEVIAGLLREGKIRSLLANQCGGDPIQTKIAYFDALAAGDFATCDAIETAPMLWAGRPGADELTEWQAERLKSKPRN